MWWAIVAAILVVACFIFYTVHRIAAERRRSASWDNLRERSKLFASQLAYFRDMNAPK